MEGTYDTNPAIPKANPAPAPKKPSRFWPCNLEGAPRCFLHALSVLCTERVYILTFSAPHLALCPHRSVVNLVHIQTPNDVRPSVVLPKNASERGVRDNHGDVYKLYAGTCALDALDRSLNHLVLL